jgi:hypothetical protein
MDAVPAINRRIATTLVVSQLLFICSSRWRKIVRNQAAGPSVCELDMDEARRFQKRLRPGDLKRLEFPELLLSFNLTAAARYVLSSKMRRSTDGR